MFKKTKVIICLLLCVVFTALFCVPASALTTTTSYSKDCSYISEFGYKITKLVIEADNYFNANPTIQFNSYGDEDRMRICFVDDGGGGANASGQFKFKFTIELQNTKYSSLAFDMLIKNYFLGTDLEAYYNQMYQTIKPVNGSGQYNWISGWEQQNPYKEIIGKVNDRSDGKLIEKHYSIGYPDEGKTAVKYIFCFGVTLNTVSELTLVFDDFEIEDKYAEQNYEENSANTSGNDSVNALGSAVPDKSADLLASFSKLTKSMVHDEAVCNIKFPQIKVPALGEGDGTFFGETVLYNGGNVDMAYYVNLIPSDVLTVIRSVLTVALILFCFKELYGFIEYALTLNKTKGGTD